ncbi:hypothetical protein Goshw_014191 [Gossypium schwendimanii]|uniref:Uncharacterized protein n=1 Tax=Gossypium schwendimanii TaxID=34291 RepID=A0A7J9KXT6_GOSSC|nr:hypothetical protein [Gossypium schwendimanii]
MHRLVCQYLIALEILTRVSVVAELEKFKVNHVKDSDNSMRDAKKHRDMHIIEAYDRENVGSFISMGHNRDKETRNCPDRLLGATQAPKLRPESALRAKL